MSNKMQIVDLRGQYEKIKSEVNTSIQKVIDDTAFINGPQVKEFSSNLAKYLNVKHVITCANGTDALQIALMALGLKHGDEVIVPAFTYVATAEVIGLLGLTPVMVDVNYDTFNVELKNIEKALSPKTKAIVPVHLFGQSADMEPILKFANKHHLFIIEDNAQAFGTVYTFSDGHKSLTGTMGTIGCTSFFPTKNLGCYGDGGALYTNDDELAEKIHIIANHGQKVKYHHLVIGCNSRLDTIQAAILDVKLKYLDSYLAARQTAAEYYNNALKDVKGIIIPKVIKNSTATYHQYTLKIVDGEVIGENGVSKRDALKAFLAEAGIPSMIYYPLPLQEQDAFKPITREAEPLPISKKLAYSVLSLPMHTELTHEIQDKVIERVKLFFK